ncbi:MAG: DUF4040 domain-containing protein [Eubacterium sp.]|nr:DUF4040 domain-containing protein [Eubacterium sp.]
MTAIGYLLLAGLIACAVAANLTRDLLPTVIIYAAFGTIMATIWLLLKAPDLAITEAAVGVGIETILFLTAIRKMRLSDRARDVSDDADTGTEESDDRETETKKEQKQLS